MFIGQALSQAPQDMQVEVFLLILNTLNRLLIPVSAPKGQAYLHHGRSMIKDSDNVTPRMISDPTATSELQKLNKAKYGSYSWKTSFPVTAVT